MYWWNQLLDYLSIFNLNYISLHQVSALRRQYQYHKLSMAHPGIEMKEERLNCET